MASVAAGVALLLAALRASAANVSCSEALGPQAVDGNLGVDGACELVGTEVHGNVTVAAGASLVARDAFIRGNLSATSASFVELRTTVVDGNARFDRTAGTSSIADSRVNGNVEISGSQSLWELTDNSFGGNVKVSANAGGIALDGNAVHGKLECDGNVPAPVGARNELRAGARGQCAALQLEAAAPPPEPGGKSERDEPPPAKPQPKPAKSPEPKAQPPKSPEPKAQPPNPPEPKAPPKSPEPRPSVSTEVPPEEAAPPVAPPDPRPATPATPPAPVETPPAAQPSFTPDPGGGGGGSVGLLEILWLPLVLALRRAAHQRRNG